jgi:hypothetical protein
MFGAIQGKIFARHIALGREAYGWHHHPMPVLMNLVIAFTVLPR